MCLLSAFSRGILDLDWNELTANGRFQTQNMRTIDSRLRDLCYLPCFRVRADSSNKMAINASSSSTDCLKLSLA